jgi:hypothetical protein
MGAEVDSSGWPLVTVKWAGTATDREIAAFLGQMDRWLARAEKFGLLIDSRGAGGLSPEQRTQVIGHMKSRSALTAQWLVQAIVFDNLVQRTLFYAINLLFPNPFPSKTFGQIEPAQGWLKARLGLDPSPDVQRAGLGG